MAAAVNYGTGRGTEDERARDGEDGDARQRGLGLLLIEERLLVVGEGFDGHACFGSCPARRKEALNGWPQPSSAAGRHARAPRARGG